MVSTQAFGEAGSNSSAAEKHQGGLRLFQEGRIEEALSLLGEALAQEGTAERWNDWATAQMAAGQMENAEAGFRRALELDTENPRITANLGTVLAANGRTQEAIPLLERCEASLLGQEKEAVAGLLAECRRNAAPGGAPGAEKLLQRLAQTLTLQTTALNMVAQKLISIEYQVTVLNYAIQSHATAAQAKPGIIPRVQVSEELEGAESITLLAPQSTVENVTLAELRILMHLLRRQKSRTAFEFGTADGRTTLNLAAQCPEDGRVFALDLGREDLGQRYKGTPYENRITQLVGDTRSFDFSPYLNSIDFVFVDANHDYEYVRSDSLWALKLLREGRGTIAWHDYLPCWKGVMEALDELYMTEPKLKGLHHIERTGLVYAQVS
jgi:predicted O-methyltransferase YrrM